VPFVFPGSKDGDDDLTFNDIDSVQYRFVKSGMFEAGPLAGAWLGRSDSDGRKLGGLGDIDAGLVLGGFAALNTGMTKITASFHHQVTGNDVGSLVRLRADTELPVAAGFKFLAGAGTNYATDGYMDTMFGVSAAQAGSSTAGLLAYNPSADFKDVFVGAGFEAELTERWTAKVYGEYARLIGDAGDSPVIETQDQFTGLLSITYQFGPLGQPAAPAPLK
jgi:MipA family protein